MNSMLIPGMPLVTVITVTYNSSLYVRDTIESVLAQTSANIEYIIGDDCSTDDTWQVVSSYNDPRIKAYRNETNLREYPNRSRAVAMATGKYLIFIDGDDLMYPHAIAVFLSYAENFPDCSMYFSREWDYRVLCPYRISPEDIYRFEYLDRGIMGGNFTNVFFNTAILQQTKLPVNITTGDTYVQLVIARHHPALVIPDGLTWWRRRTGNATDSFFSNQKSAAETFGYRLALLNDDCPLNWEEREMARKNIYGNYLRMLVRLLAKGNLKEIIFLLKAIKVPAKFYHTVFLKGNYNYFNFIKGDHPLHTGPESYKTIKA